MTEIWFVRHGETTANAEGIWQGQGDAALSARGREQAAVLGARLTGTTFGVAVTSDLERAGATAAAAGLRPEADPAFREMDVGRWEGLTHRQVMARYPDEVAALVGGDGVAIGGGETWAGFCARVDTAVDALFARLGDGDRALVVTHGGVVHTVVSGLLRFRARGRPWPVEHVRNTALTVVVAGGRGRRVRTFNDATHLEAAPPPDPTSTVVGLARHGESVANLADVWHGTSDGPLSARGLLQGAELAARYDTIDHIYTSHLQRARLTAAAFVGGRGTNLTVRPDLHEVAFGAWEGLTTAEIRERFPEDWAATYEHQGDLRRGRTGETAAGAAARMRRAIEQIATAHPGGRVLVFTHGGAIRACVGSVVGPELAARDLLEGPGNASVSHLRVGPAGTVVVDYNLGLV